MADEKKNWLLGIRDYVNELKLEMRRVSWPSRKQVEGTTGVVIFAVFAFAFYFMIVDDVLSWGINNVLTFFTK